MNTTLLETVVDHLSRIYLDQDTHKIAKKAIETMGLSQSENPSTLYKSEKDAWVTTYGGSIKQQGQAPLKTLKIFADKYLKDSISGLHILPFFPYSSDEGFSVINYSQVNDGLGDWQDIETIGRDYDLMSDLVINHCSQQSRWFENFRQRNDPGKDYFVEADPKGNTSDVVRPRTSPLLRETRTLDGQKHV